MKTSLVRGTRTGHIPVLAKQMLDRRVKNDNTADPAKNLNTQCSGKHKMFKNDETLAEPLPMSTLKISDKLTSMLIFPP
jgi:hypothetical protein